MYTHTQKEKKKETGNHLSLLQNKEEYILTKHIPFLQRQSLFDPTPSILNEML